MEIGCAFFCQNLHEDLSDAEMIRQEARLAVLAEELGFDYVNFPEHHFDDYSLMPDNAMVQSWVAARTSRIKLMLGVCVLPWHDPLRVAEKASLLDALSGGRVILGFGRGLAKLEYDAFRIDMSEARERFDEAAPMVIRALETGVVSGDGPFYVQPPVPLRPRVEHSFAGRIAGVAMSPGSTEAVARIKARLVCFTTRPIEEHAPAVAAYREFYRDFHGEEPPPPIFSDFTFCHPDPQVADEVFHRYLLPSAVAETRHYDLDGEAFARAQVKGYESYAESARALQEMTDKEAADARADVLAWGTPDRIVEIYQHRLDVLGAIDPIFSVPFGGMPYNLVEESMRNMAEILPRLRALRPAVPA